MFVLFLVNHSADKISMHNRSSLRFHLSPLVSTVSNVSVNRTPHVSIQVNDQRQQDPNKREGGEGGKRRGVNFVNLQSRKITSVFAFPFTVFFCSFCLPKWNLSPTRRLHARRKTLHYNDIKSRAFESPERNSQTHTQKMALALILLGT